MVTALTRIRKEMDSLLYKLSIISSLLGSKYDALKSNEINSWIQVTSLTSIPFFVYANDFSFSNYDFNIGLCVIATYACTSIKTVTIIEFTNLVSLLRQTFSIVNNYLPPAEDEYN
jgi:hypothetical protein